MNKILFFGNEKEEKRKTNIQRNMSSNLDALSSKNTSLQAVVFADSYSVSFRPITLEQPKVLLPLANVPMIAYALEFLASGNVNEVFVYCSSHGKQISEYIQNSKWSKLAPEFRVRIVLNPEATCVGDALRHLDNLQLLVSDFVMISGDVITNMKLAPVLEAHQKRGRENPLNIMTVVMKKASHNHRTRTLDDDLFVVLGGEKSKGQLLAYNNDLTHSEVGMDLTFLHEHKSVDIHYDLMDCHIDICSPQVLMLFTENFDFQSLRHDFIQGILTSDLVGNKIYAHVVDGEYAARCQDLRTYDSISKDVVHRWTHPMVPDNNMLMSTTYQMSRGNIYKEEGVNLTRTCKIGMDTMLGSGTSIGARSYIKSSVIGRNCNIADDVCISSSYIWDTCLIKSNSKLDQVVLCNNVIINENVTIGKGSVISFNVEIPSNAIIPPYSKVTTIEPIDDPNSDDEEEECDVMNNIERSKGRYYECKKDNKLIIKVKVNEKLLKTYYTSSYYNDNETSNNNHDLNSSIVYKQDDEDEDDDDIKLREFDVLRKHINSIAPPEETQYLCLYDDDDDLKDFDIQDIHIMDNKEEELIREVKETLQRAHNDHLEIDGIVLDMTNIKLSIDATLTDYAMATFLAFLSLIGAEPNAESSLKITGKIVKTLKGIINHWSPVLGKFLRDVDDQMCILMGLEAACLYSTSLHAFFQFVLQQIYELELVSEEAVLKWEELRISQAKENNTDISLMVSKAEVFLSWLKEEEDEDDEDSEEEESD